MTITYYGHSSFTVEVEGVNLLFDPFISPNESAKAIDLSSIKADYILVSHGHSDHVADVETLARQNDATIVAVYELASYYGGKNLKYHPMNTGGSWDFGKFKVKAVNAVHSSVLPDGTYSGNPIGFIITSANHCFYYSGDTALHTDMKLLGDQFKIDTAFLCIGDNFTMGIDDALLASRMLNCKNVVGMHFDTFPYIRINHERAIKTFTDDERNLKLPVIGETWNN